jgi:hypothetical protein
VSTEAGELQTSSSVSGGQQEEAEIWAALDQPLALEARQPEPDRRHGRLLLR